MIGTRKSNGLKWSGSLNNTRRAQNFVSRSDVVRNATISFTSTATIGDSGSAMGAIQVGDAVEVRGSASNCRWWRPSSAAAGSLTVAPAQVTTIAASPTIQLVRQ